MVKFGPAFASVVLLGCSPVEQSPAGEAPQQAKQAEERSLAGTYMVIYVNEAEPVIGIEGSEPTVTIGADRINFISQCIYDDWSYTRQGESIATGPFNYGESVAMCARSLAPGEEAISAAFDRADTVRFVRSGLWFSGPGGTVQLKRIPSAEETASRSADLTGAWTVESIDGKALSYELPVEADFEQIWWEPGCAGQSVRYSIDGVAFRLAPREAPDMVCEIGFPPEVPQIWEAMAASNTIEWVNPASVVIRGGGRSVVLIRR